MLVEGVTVIKVSLTSNQVGPSLRRTAIVRSRSAIHITVVHSKIIDAGRYM